MKLPNRTSLHVISAGTFRIRTSTQLEGRNTFVGVGWLTIGGHDALVGAAVRHPDDAPDDRVGIWLALRRAIAKVPNLTRGQQRELRRAFYQSWPEAHPQYRTPRPLTVIKVGDGAGFRLVDKGKDTGEVLTEKDLATLLLTMGARPISVRIAVPLTPTQPTQDPAAQTTHVAAYMGGEYPIHSHPAAEVCPICVDHYDVVTRAGR